MEEQKDIETTDSTNGEETEETKEESVQEETEESKDEKTEDVEVLKEQNKKLYARVKKAEGFELVDGKWVKKPKEQPKPTETKKPESSLSEKDLLAIMQANVSAEDLDEVKRIAKVLEMPVREALKQKLAKDFLANKAEERTSAQVANTRSARGSTKVSGDVLIEKARKGELPETDIEKLAEAIQIAKKQKK